MREPNHYDYAPWAGRPRIVWPEGARIAFWVAPNIEYYEIAPPPSAARSVWYRPEPDVLNHAHRDYGNRVGFHRMAEVMHKHGVRGSVSLNVALCDHLPEIIETTSRLGWELFSHGVYNTRYLYDLTEDQQRDVIRDCRETVRKYSGQTLDGWLSPAVSNIATTQDILAEEGIKYTLDLFHDDQPTPLKVRSGKPLISVPYSIEINDVPVFNFRQLSPQEYVEMCKAQFDRLYLEGEQSGTVMCMPLHPYLIGQPHRIRAFDEILRYVTTHDGVWLATGREIADWYIANYRDEALAWIAAQNGGAR